MQTQKFMFSHHLSCSFKQESWAPSTHIQLASRLPTLSQCFIPTHRLNRKWGCKSVTWREIKNTNYISQNLYCWNTLTKVKNYIDKNFYCNIFHYFEQLIHGTGAVDKLWYILMVELYANAVLETATLSSMNWCKNVSKINITWRKTTLQIIYCTLILFSFKKWLCV